MHKKLILYSNVLKILCKYLWTSVKLKYFFLRLFHETIKEQFMFNEKLETWPVLQQNGQP